MSVSHLRVVPRAGAPHHARLSSLAKALKRFRPEIRDGVVQLARRHMRLAELAESFPALLAALAWPRAGFDARLIIRGVIAGLPLPLLAEAARVPLWLRKMPTEMIVAPLPQLPDSAFVRHRIVNHFPKNRKLAALWFESVAFAARWAHEEFAIWVAQVVAGGELRDRRGRLATEFYLLHRLCLWAWHSGRPGIAAHTLIAAPWKPEMQFKAAANAANGWYQALELALSLMLKPVEDMWLTPAAVDGYDFVPLRTARDLCQEAEAMGNCVQTYGEAMARNDVRLWSVRKDGARIATLEVVRYQRVPLPYIRQLQLAKNGTAPPELWVVAGKWLRTLELTAAGMRVTAVDWQTDGAAWRALWKPYWLAMRRVPKWLPVAPVGDAMNYI